MTLKAVIPLAATNYWIYTTWERKSFRIKDTGKIQWYDGQILNYDPSSGQYGVHFPSDHQIIY